MNALVTLRNTALRRRDGFEDPEEEDRTLIGQAVHTALTPIRIATSRPAIKAYLTTLLFFLTSIVLISISTTAYFLFYYNFIPQIGLTQTVYLQYDTSAHPHATIAIDASALIPQQPYDIFITLHMPRTPSNIAAGNFMLDLSLHSNTAASVGPLSYLLNTTSDASRAAPLARSRRPAILPYNSVVTSLSHKLLHLPAHLLSLKDLDASVLNIDMFERLSFPRGRSNIPTIAYLEVQSQTPPTGCPPTSQPAIGLHLLPALTQTSTSAIQIYSAQLNFHARFEGMRYYVYKYRIISFLIFTWLFYTFALTSMAVAWAFVSALLSARKPQSTLPKKAIAGRTKTDDSAASTGRSPRVKKEDSDELGLEGIKAEDDSDLDIQLDSRALANLSGTERIFPTIGRNAQPLRYTPSSTTAPSEEAESPWAVRRDDNTQDAEDEEDEPSGRRERVITPTSAELQELQDMKDEDDEDGRFRGDSGIGTSMESENVSGGLGLSRRRSSRGGSRGSGSRR